MHTFAKIPYTQTCATIPLQHTLQEYLGPNPLARFKLGGSRRREVGVGVRGVGAERQPPHPPPPHAALVLYILFHTFCVLCPCTTYFAPTRRHAHSPPQSRARRVKGWRSLECLFTDIVIVNVHATRSLCKVMRQRR